VVTHPQPQPPVQKPSLVQPIPVLSQQQISIATAQQQVMEENLRQLASMGFTDREMNSQLLAANNGDIVQTIQQLLHD